VCVCVYIYTYILYGIWTVSDGNHSLLHVGKLFILAFMQITHWNVVAVHG